MEKVKIYDLAIPYEKIYRNVKYHRLEFKTGKLRLILQKNCKDDKYKVDKILERHKNWIYNNAKAIEDAKDYAKNNAMNNLVKKRGIRKLNAIVIHYVKKFSDEINTEVKHLCFRKMVSKWGSCSANGKITFNTYLKYLPEELIQYVVFHEVLHLKEKNHSKKFWEITGEKFKNHKVYEKEMLAYGFLMEKRHIKF
ncbi:MAG: metal-dependent hydrolase [Candidatus Altiarchaeales archaeon HGW-Altiarchaeales-2]|nr:MAG: metal-dependent hydrolase [Candidatus Altiarchaeales archaeon HGW-Altiarchaeales-2]